MFPWQYTLYNLKVILAVQLCVYLLWGFCFVFFYQRCWKIDGIGDSARCCIQYGLSCDKLNVIHIWLHTVFWWFRREVASCYPGTLFLLTEKQLRGGLGGEKGGPAVGGWGISTDLDTITVPSPLLPHHFWPCSHSATGNRKAQLSGRRFGQSGIKCKALFSHSVPGVGTPGDLHCPFSHTSLSGAVRILGLRKVKWVER